MGGGYTPFQLDESFAFGQMKWSGASYSRQLCDVASGASDFAQLIITRNTSSSFYHHPLSKVKNPPRVWQEGILVAVIL